MTFLYTDTGTGSVFPLPSSQATIQGKFPSSKMIHKLATALGIDPTELFYKEIDPETAIKNAQKIAIENIGEAVNQLVSDFFADKVKQLK